MGNKEIMDLSKGIRLENSKTLVPWKTNLNELKSFGSPETRLQQGKEIVVWKNERILNGLKVDLSVVYESGILGENKRLKAVSAYISESDFDRAKNQLDLELRKKAKFTKLNELEYQYTWKMNNCKLVLSHLDRFGSFWKLDIRHRLDIAHLINPGRLLRKLFVKEKQAEESGPLYFKVVCQEVVLRLS